MWDLLSSPELWVAVAFVVFVGVAQKNVRQIVGAGLDEQAASIRGEIDEAQNLRDEAQALLASYKRQHSEAVAETKAILDQARDEAKFQSKAAEAALALTLRRREQRILERISRIEATALAEIRQATADLALRTTEKIMAAHLTEKRADRLVDTAIADLENLLN